MQIQSFITTLLSPLLHIMFNNKSKNTKLEKLSKTNSCIITDILSQSIKTGSSVGFHC